MSGLESFAKRIEGRSDSDIYGVYKSLMAGVQCKSVKKRLTYIKQNFPNAIKKGEEKKKAKEIARKQSTGVNKPYQVRLADKYLQLFRSSVKRGKEFNLTLKDVHNILQQKTCYYTGTVFEESGPNMRTVDRVDNSLGYVKGNVVACTLAANQAKEHLFEKSAQDLNVDITFICKVVNTVLSFYERRRFQ